MDRDVVAYVAGYILFNSFKYSGSNFEQRFLYTVQYGGIKFKPLFYIDSHT